MRLDRYYKLEIDLADGQNTIIIEPPIRITFNVSRDILGKPNTCNIVVFNLKEENRKRIYNDRYNQGVYKRFRLFAGYKDDYKLIFSGNITEANSQKDRADFVTNIVCQDGGFGISNSITSKSYNANTKTSKIDNDLCDELLNIEKGNISPRQEENIRGKCLLGKTYQLLHENNDSNHDIYIDNEKINILKKDTIIGDTTFVIDSSSGLLETPKKEENIITVKTLMYAGINVGSKVLLKSTQTELNGIHKVLGITYNGDLEGNSWTTEFQLLAGKFTNF